jgi:hypothetical protein
MNQSKFQSGRPRLVSRSLKSRFSLTERIWFPYSIDYDEARIFNSFGIAVLDGAGCGDPSFKQRITPPCLLPPARCSSLRHVQRNGVNCFWASV